MSEHKAHIEWARQSTSFAYDQYNREHTWTFENGHVFEASAAPAFFGHDDCVDPEEAFVASISACHMLTLLAICARKRMVVESYDDHAVGFLEKGQNGRLMITRVILRPNIVFADDAAPDAETMDRLHASAHRACFIANSVTTTITVENS
jgi:organic hydroperoxide reductase OsmC/OhrA